ncbi:MAG: 2-oxoacid:acceptor oxidoreductase subunit alpha [Phycisphaerae bacterium]|nr:2-oxoacid:acceptor oxidoreductase subunit alpha [Phycisphaerae bacterium]
MGKSFSGIRKDVSVVLCGSAGMGVQTVERLLVRIFKQAGYHVFATKEYMSRVRGGMNSVTIRVSSKPVQAEVDRIDVLIPLDKGAIEHVQRRLTGGTLILAEPDYLNDAVKEKCPRCMEVAFTEIAKAIGNKLYSNVVAVGVVGAIFGINPDLLTDFIRKRFSGKEQNVIDENVAAVEKGYEIGNELCEQHQIRMAIEPDSLVNDQILVNGVEAVGLGAIAGGCNFIGAYPMSPSTGLLTFLAKHAREFGIVVEQAEDEIAGVNMAIGAWYAGARAVASTSGGGFALMTEGVSLAGMMESPLVVHLAQRPGPATGLPTRTGQEDLNLALYAGHGEFPRAIFAPGNPQQAFDLTARAFNLAAQYQVPVFILTDQYFVDTYYNTPPFDASAVKVEHHFVETGQAYRRFEITENGISPRGIPGYGKGLVVADSDEHDEAGHITEDLDLRVRMVDKRLSKGRLLEEAVIEPTLWPNEDFKTLVLCWGSTLPIMQEAIAVFGRDDVSLLHFAQVFPLPIDLRQTLEQAETIICLEGNATGQFADLVELHTGISVDEFLLKYNGLNFTVEDVVASLEKMIG